MIGGTTALSFDDVVSQGQETGDILRKEVRVVS
jgi:hypothetical protein